MFKSTLSVLLSTECSHIYKYVTCWLFEVKNKMSRNTSVEIVTIWIMRKDIEGNISHYKSHMAVNRENTNLQ